MSRNSSSNNFQFCKNIEISNQRFKQTRYYNGKIKQRPIRQIQAHSCIFRHIQACSEIIQAHSGILKMLRNPNIFRTLSNIYDGVFYKNCEQLQLFSQIKIIFAISAFHILYFFKIKVYFLLQKYLFYIKNYSGPGGQSLQILIYPYCVVVFFL